MGVEKSTKAFGGIYVESIRLSGKLHSTTAPSITHRRVSDGKVLREEWYQFGVRHAPAGQPALSIYCPESGTIIEQRFYRNGKLSRGDGPAAIVSDPKTGMRIRQEWYLAGMKSRQGDLPAVTIRDAVTAEVTLEEYWLHGKHRLTIHNMPPECTP